MEKKLNTKHIEDLHRSGITGTNSTVDLRVMRIVSLSACTRVAPHVARKLPDDIHHVNTNASQAVVRTRNRRGGKIVRQLITLEQLIDDLKAQDIELDEAFIDIDDVVQIPEVKEQD